MRFPPEGWLEGGIAELAILLHRSSIPAWRVVALGDALELGVNRAAAMFTATHPIGSSLGLAVAQLLGQHDDSAGQTRRMAMTVLVEGLQGSLRHSRLVFDALLPTFPAIGFIATVSSLLTAMSKADQIVKATDPIARGIATSIVTDTLSLCFASTFMALICLVILTPLSMHQDGIEQQLIADTEADLQRVLRPEKL